MATCYVQDCGRKILAKGLCERHYARHRRTGTPLGAGHTQHHGLTLKGRLLARVEKSGGCWEWMGGRDGKGYGRMNVANRPILVHRISWEVHRGPIPSGANILHRCDNPSCVRPSHLFLGSQADNMADKMRKGRHRYGHHVGSAHPRAKLTEAQVREILTREESTQALAKEYGVSSGTMSAVRHRLTWRHVQIDTPT